MNRDRLGEKIGKVYGNRWHGLGNPLHVTDETAEKKYYWLGQFTGVFVLLVVIGLIMGIGAVIL